MNDHYIGAELEIFAAASNWKTYIAQKIGQFIHGRVLEVGAGIGANTRVLYSARVCEWTCLEPDPDLAGRIKGPRKRGDFPLMLSRRERHYRGTRKLPDRSIRSSTSMCSNTSPTIEQSSRVRLGCFRRRGHVIVLGPAHQFLFSRSTQRSAIIGATIGRCCERLTPPDCVLEISMMLDSAGFFASMANRFLLSAPLPSKRQIAVWDKLLVPVSRVLDRMTGYRFGKSSSQSGGRRPEARTACYLSKLQRDRVDPVHLCCRFANRG